MQRTPWGIARLVAPLERRLLFFTEHPSRGMADPIATSDESEGGHPAAGF